jgi:hypothetical protein
MSKLLNNILKVAKEHEPLLDYFPNGIMNLFSNCVDELDSDWRYYGITKDKRGKFSFCYSDGHRSMSVDKNDMNYISIKRLKEDIKQYGPSSDEIKTIFLNKIRESIQQNEIVQANINDKVNKKLNNLKERLEN